MSNATWEKTDKKISKLDEEDVSASLRKRALDVSTALAEQGATEPKKVMLSEIGFIDFIWVKLASAEISVSVRPKGPPLINIAGVGAKLEGAEAVLEAFMSAEFNK